MNKILIVDDDKDIRFILSRILKEAGYDVVDAQDGRKALKILQDNCQDLVLLDMRLPEMDGMKILEKMKEFNHNLVIIMITAYSDVKDAVKAMRLGAYDYITKPFDNDELILVIKKALEAQNLSKEVEVLRKRFAEKTAAEHVMGRTPQIERILKQISIVAPTKMTVVIQGESGTGKEIVANMIHLNSQRKDKPFIAIDCGAIPDTLFESELFGYEKGAFSGAVERKEGKFEQANGGTLFLDEISNLPLPLQMKLLRVIEEKILQHLGGKKDIKADVRIIVATNINLDETVRQGRFREDLFHRLNEFCIDMPPLRERKEDIPFLAMHFIEEANQEFNKKIELTPETTKLLLNHHWQGNVRELKNTIKRAVLLADSNYITPTDILIENIDTFEKPDFYSVLTETTSLKETIKKATAKIEKEAIREALIKTGGNKSQAAKLLKIDRMTFYSKIKEFQLE